MSNGEMLAYQAGKHYGEKSTAVKPWDLTDEVIWDSLVAGGVRCSERLSPERAVYWWQRGYRVGNLTSRPSHVRY